MVWDYYVRISNNNRGVGMSKVCKYTDPWGTYWYTKSDILKEYYECWCDNMRKVGKESMISEDACIEDWVVVHWAEEIK